MSLYRVRFNREDTEGHRPAVEADKVRRKLAALLKRQGMTLDHADAEGFEYYAQTRKARKTPSSSARRRGPTGPRLARTCAWTFKGPRRRDDHWLGYRVYRCPLRATTFLSDWEAYCDLHADKGVRRAEYQSRQEAV